MVLSKLLIPGAAAILVMIASAGALADVDFPAKGAKEVYNPDGNFYVYAPSVILEDTKEHIFACKNPKDGVFRDEIIYIKRENGKITENKVVLKAGPAGAWDSFHVCDPCVVAGIYIYEGKTYNFAMFYLGNDVDASRHNQVGVAFAESLDGEWVKYPKPVIAYPDDGSWGTGQPSATSVDGNGRLLLFYTKGTPTSTAGYRRDINLHDMSSPIIGDEVRLSAGGLTDRNENDDTLNNFDLVYDPSRDRFFGVREQHPYPSTNPNYIGEALQIVSAPGGNIWGGAGEWTVEGVIEPLVTGFPRNHNGGIARTIYGTLPDPERLRVFFADGAVVNAGRAEWTYDLWEITGTIK